MQFQQDPRTNISKETLEFKNGELKVVTEPSTNRISTNRYTLFNFVPVVALQLLKRTVYLFYIVIMIINLVPSNLFAFKKSVFEIPILLSIAVFILKELFSELMRRSNDQRVNSELTKICTENNEDKQLRYDQIKVGDILYLKRGDIVPADLLLLDSLEIKDRQAITFIQTACYDGRINTTRKKAPYITQLLSKTQQKNNWRNYKKIISGKLTIESANNRPKDFYGYMKLTKDPKVQKLSIQNFIPRGSVIKTSGWIFGMVIYAGMNTKIMMNSSYAAPKPSGLQSMITRCLTPAYIIWLVMFSLVSLAFNFLIPKQIMTVRSSWDVFKLNVMIFSSIIPISVYILLDIYQLINALLIKRTLLDEVQILNPKPLFDLGALDFALLDKTGTLTTSNYKVEQIITETSHYTIDLQKLSMILNMEERRAQPFFEEDSARPLNNQKKKKTVVEKKSTKSIKVIPNNQEVDSLYPKILNYFEIDDGFGHSTNHILHNEDGKERKGIAKRSLQSLRLNQKHYASNLINNQSQIIQIQNAFVLCHDAQIGYDAKKNVYISHSAAKQQQVLHEFSKLCGWYIQRSDVKQKINVRINNQPFKYQLVGINSFTYNRRRMSIVYLQNPEDCQSTIICKAHPRRLIRLMKLSQEEQDRFEDIINDLQKRGLKPIMFAQRRLSKSQTDDYQKNFWRLKFSLISTQSDFENLAQRYENDLQLVCIVALKDQLQDGAPELISQLRQSGVRCWLLSGDSKESTINVGKFLSSEQKLKMHHIYGQNTQQVKARIFSILTQFQMQLSPQKLVLDKTRNSRSEEVVRMSAQDRMGYIECNLLVSGPSINFIQKDPNILKHFIYATTFCKNLLAYSLTPKQKAFLARLIKNYYPGKPCVLAVGDAMNDALMFQQASVSIQLASDNNNGVLASPNAADLRVKSLKTLSKLLLEMNVQPFMVPIRGLMYVMYKSWIYTVVVFLMNCFQLFISENILSSPFLFIDSVFIAMGNSLILSYVDQDISKDMLRIYPGLYSQARLSRTHYFYNFCKNFLIEGVLHGVIIFFNTYYCLMSEVTVFDHSTKHLYLALYFSLALVSAVHTALIASSRKTFVGLACLSWTILIIACTILLNQATSYFQFNVNMAIPTFFSRFSCVIVMIVNVLICMVFSCLYRIIFIQTTLTDWLQKKFPERPKNQELLKFMEKDRKIIDIVRHVFQNSVDIEGSVVQMCNYSAPASFNINEMRLNQSLEIVDQTIENKFNFEKRKHSLQIYKQMMILLALSLIAITIINAITTSRKTVMEMSIAFACIVLFLLVFALVLDRLNLVSLILVCVLLVYKVAFQWVNIGEMYIPLLTLVLNCFITINYRQQLTQVFVLLIFSTVSTSIRQGTLYYFKTTQLEEIATYYFAMYSSVIVIIYLLLNAGLLVYFNYEQVKIEKADFLTQVKIEKESQHTQEILGILVPKFVQKQMQKRLFSMQKPEHKVSILFCYVCNFDLIIKEEGKNVVVLLDELFRQFDQLCPGFGVQKIETVGMTYMAATGLKTCEDQMDQYVLYRDQTERLLNMAIEMVAKTKGIMYGKNKDKQLQIKIGIHLGKVIAGVIGHHKPQFSLIGDAVNTTSRHCSKANSKEIVVSEAAFQKVKHKTQNFKQSYVKMKGLNNGEPVLVYRIGPQPLPILKIVEKFRRGVDELIRMERDFSDRKRMVINHEDIVKSIKEYLKNQNNQEQLVLPEDQVKGDFQPVLPEIGQHIEEDEKHLNPSCFLLMLSEDISYSKFKAWQQGRYGSRDIVFTVILLTVYFLHSLVYLLFSKFFLKPLTSDYLLGISILRGAICLLLLSNVFFINKGYYQLKYRIISNLSYIFCLGSCFLSKMIFTDLLQIGTLFQVVSIFQATLYLCILRTLSVFQFVDSLIIMLLGMVVPWFAINFKDNLLINYFCMMGVCLHSCLFSYINYSYKIGFFNFLIKNEIKKQEEKGIVSQLLPTHAFLKLKSEKIDNKLELTDEFENVTILFADIQGFTAYSNRNNQNPEKVVEMLRKLFTDFDKCCLKFKVYKLYTIGDCYVIMGFTNAYYRNPLQEALNVISMAANMVEIIKRTRQQLDFQELNMRIGIHTGNIIGGIIGTQIVRYDIYGRDVLIANKFQENGQPSMIHISDTTKILIDKDKNFPYECVPHGTVNVEKLGVKIPGYLLMRKH